MELLENNDPIKTQLLQRSAQHREQLEEDVKFISDRTEKIITNALIIGGSLALTYFIVSRFTGGSKNKKKSKTAKIKLVQPQQQVQEEAQQESAEPGIVAQVGTALASQATMFLLNLAKEKLTEYMQSQMANKETK